MQDCIMCFLIGVCTILMTLSFITDSMPKRMRFSLFSMSLASILLLIANKLTYFYDGSLTLPGLVLTKICKFLAYGLFLVIIYFFNQYLRELFTREEKMDVIPKSLGYIDLFLFAGMLTLIISQFTGFYYYYDDTNTYIRTKWYFVSYLFPQIAIFCQLIVIIWHHKKLNKRLFVPIILFIIIPMVAGIVQFFVHGVFLTSIFIVAMTALLYFFSVFDTNKIVKNAHQREIDFLLEEQEHEKQLISQTVAALAEAIDAKDKYTNGHSRRVAEYSVKIAERAGKDKVDLEKLYLIGLLHDVGKIGIPDAIINKEGRLTDEEYAIIKTHPSIGREILSKISLSPELGVGASFHHERYDGKGYPFGLKGEEIPELARIIAVADTYDAMASKRSYRDILPKEKIRSELKNGIGTQFDPRFASIMIEILDEEI